MMVIRPNLAAPFKLDLVLHDSAALGYYCFCGFWLWGTALQIEWLSGKAGQALFRQECQLANAVLERVFGDQIVQIGVWGPAGQLLESARTQAALVLAATPGERGDAQTAPERLAIRTDSVDAVLLPHTLELSAEPHAVLREVQRILRPDGKLIILGFNPYSGWGMRHQLSIKGYPEGIFRYISKRRLADWLHLLNLRVDELRPCYARRSANGAMRLFQRTGCFASGYLLTATKEIIPATVVRPRLGRRAALVQGLVNPTTRNAARAGRHYTP